MTECSEAVERLTRAVDGLEQALAKALARPLSGADGEGAQLAQENAALKAAAAKDAELRREATEAVKAALADLRTLMPEDKLHG
ncbi:MAG: hypothetical protein AAFR79_13705 [Pseudomonadota bacterium]